MDQPTEMMRRVAEAAALPVASDEPETSSSGVPYDAGLQQDLLDHGPEALKEYGVIVVRDVADEARYNSAVWYALSQLRLDGSGCLHYELKNGCVFITDPSAS